MKRALVLLAVSVSAVLAQTPAVTAVQEAGSNTADVPQGAIFVVKGTDLSAAGVASATPPAYPTTLNNVHVTLTAVSGGLVVNALMVSTYNQSGVSELFAVLPSTATIGAYDLRVFNGASTSATFRMNVVARKVGIATADGSGAGQVQATLAGGQVLARRSNQGKIGPFDTRPAKPNERVDLWGTGVGADAASDTGGTSGDQTAAGAIRVVVDGVDVTPAYAGRSQGSPGLDQIAFTMPANVTQSCTVPIQVRAGGVLGNPVTIAVSNTDTCTDSGGGNPGGTTPTQQEIDAWIARGNYVLGIINLDRSTTYATQFGTGTTTVTKTDNISGEFSRVSGADLANLLHGTLPAGYPNLSPAVGNCTVYTLPLGITNPYPNLTVVNLDAGAQLTSSGPNGAQPVPRQSTQVGPVYNTGSSLPDTYLAAGSYTLSGPGGMDVGTFTGNLTVASDLVVTDAPADLMSITRANGVTVHWTGGDPSGIVTISGSSIDLTAHGAAFVCRQNASAGQFTVPAAILTQLPASVAIQGFAIPGAFSVGSSGAGARFASPSGVDFLTAGNFWTWGYGTQYK